MTPVTRNLSAFAILGATFLARWPFRAVPLIRDEGELAQLAQSLRAGVVPYLELYNQKPPVGFTLIALIQSFGGETVEALRLGTTLWFLLGGGALFVAMLRWSNDRAALLALAAYCAMGFGQAGFFHQASTEVFTLPWIVLGLAAWLRARTGGGPASAMTAGVALAIAYQTKQTAIALGAAIALDALLAGRNRAVWRSAGWAALAACGATAALAAVLASAGALDAYLAATWTHNWAYVGARHLADAPSLLLPVAGPDSVLWVAGGLGLVGLGVSQRTHPLRTVALLGVTTFAAASFAGHAYAHYYVPLIVPLAAGLGLGVTQLEGRVPRFAIGILIACVFAPPMLRAGQQLIDADRAISEVLAQAPAVRDAREVARYLAARTEPGEPIAVVGSEPQISFLANRPAALRMAILYPVSGGYPHSPGLLEELTATLQEAPTRYVALAEDWRSFAEARPRGEQLRQRLKRLLARHYESDRRFEGAFEILRRIDDPAPPLLLLITTDTLRADHIGAYGSTRSETPRLDELAEESLLFTASYAPAPYTMPSIAALHTGRYPEELGILANHALFRGTDATLAQRLQQRGWRTGAVVSNYVLRQGTGIEIGFERYDDRFPNAETNRDQPERIAKDTTSAALGMLDELMADPAEGVFLWVHYQDPHGPYLPPHGHRARHLESARNAPGGDTELPVRGLNPIAALPSYQLVEGRRDVAFYRAGYAGEVEYVDAEIGRLLDAVAERSSPDRTTVIFTADHGESLGEDDYWFAHGSFLSDALVRVPLLIRAPGLPAAKRSDIVSLVDLMPTLLARTGDREAPPSSGRDLLAEGAADFAGRAYLANLMGSADKRWGWVADGHVLVLEHGQDGSTRPTLRNLATGDPVADAERLARLRAELDGFRAKLRVQPEIQQRLSPQDVEMLRRLGYVE